MKEITDRWDATLLEYGLALKHRSDMERQMFNADNVEVQDQFYELWDQASTQVTTLRGKIAIIAKHMAVDRAEQYLKEFEQQGPQSANLEAHVGFPKKVDTAQL